ncbi:MAG: hypothetical protein JRH10_16555, partial [Deltaproteobacteria bacterium]|nr:hypothetical protein [Deltaproteobacteria bacterium]
MSRPVTHVTPSAKGQISGDEPFRFDVCFAAAPPARCNVTVDLYDPSTPAHPEGHFAYWSFATSGERRFSIEVDPTRDPPVRVLGHPLRITWENPDLDLVAATRVALNVVLGIPGEPPLEIQAFRWVRSHEALDGTEALLEAPGYVRALAPPALDLEPDARVHIVATNIRVGDAIGNLALDALRALRLHGFDTRLYARETDPELWGVAEPVEALSKHARAGDLVFYQYSVADPDLGVVLDSPAAKVCFY